VSQCPTPVSIKLQVERDKMEKSTTRTKTVDDLVSQLNSDGVSKVFFVCLSLHSRQYALAASDHADVVADTFVCQSIDD
jgi:hypothetical protein